MIKLGILYKKQQLPLSSIFFYIYGHVILLLKMHHKEKCYLPDENHGMSSGQRILQNAFFFHLVVAVLCWPTWKK